MNAKALAVFIVFLTNFRLCQGIRYDNFIMYRTVPLQQHQLNFLLNLVEQKYIQVKFWQKPYKLYQSVQLIVRPQDVEEFLERAHHFGLNIEQMNTNVQDLFDRQNKDILRFNKFGSESYTWNTFHSPQQVNQWINDVAQRNPQFCQIISIGRSAENKDIYALSIFRGNSKGTVIVEGGMHGNEWISTEFVTYLANSLTSTNIDTDYRLEAVANNYHWYLIPVANPDGYEYNHKTDRMWRKNRRRIFNDTFGVDLNRNFRYSFGKHGTSNLINDDMYCGPKPFSEPETVALSKFVTRHAKDLRYYFSIHAYGQQIMIPYGDTILHVDNYAECENLAKQALQKMYKMHGQKYSVGNSYDLRGHKISGNSASWVKNTFKVPYVFTFLLRDNGTYGYGIHPQEILPTCQEVQTGILEIMTTTVRKLKEDDVYGERLSRVRCNRAFNGLLISGVVVWLAI